MTEDKWWNKKCCEEWQEHNTRLCLCHQGYIWSLPLKTSCIFPSILSSDSYQSCSFTLLILTVYLFRYLAHYFSSPLSLWWSFSCLLPRDWWLQTAAYRHADVCLISPGSTWFPLVFCQTFKPSNKFRASYSLWLTAITPQPSRKAERHARGKKERVALASFVITVGEPAYWFKMQLDTTMPSLWLREHVFSGGKQTKLKRCRINIKLMQQPNSNFRPFTPDEGRGLE